ncbi:MAG: nucleotide exchange factor GrpE [Prevotella sp.]|nr:nucleotide exchange factor GrpE [Prevotella sp.]
MTEEEIKETEEIKNAKNAESQDNQDAPENSDAVENPDTSDKLEDEPSELEQLKDKYLRAVAEFDNYRKRTMKEKAELILNGSEKTVKAVLPVVDDMERAIANAQKTDDPEVLKEGMLLIFQKMEKALESLGVKKIETEGKDFDVDFHDAIAMVPGMGEDKKGKVLDCVLTGYTLNDKVIRHAKVAVGE